MTVGFCRRWPLPLVAAVLFVAGEVMLATGTVHL